MDRDNRPGGPALLRQWPATIAVAYALTARMMQNFMWDQYRGRCSDAYAAETHDARSTGMNL
jgi:hypothetical protein